MTKKKKSVLSEAREISAELSRNRARRPPADKARYARFGPHSGSPERLISSHDDVNPPIEAGRCTACGVSARLRENCVGCTERAQSVRLKHKEEQRAREVVDCTIKFIVTNPRNADEQYTFEAAAQMTRGQLEDAQGGHADGTLLINWIKEDK